MTEASDGKLFGKLLNQGVKMAVSPENAPNFEYREFFSISIPGANEANIYLNTCGWLITKDASDGKSNGLLFNPDDLPIGLSFAPIGIDNNDGKIIHKYVVYNPEAAIITTIQAGDDTTKEQPLKGVDLDRPENQNKLLYSDSGIQIYVKTRLHIVDFPPELLKSETYKSILEEISTQDNVS